MVAGAEGFQGSTTEDVRGQGVAVRGAASGITEIVERVEGGWGAIRDGSWLGPDADGFDEEVRAWAEKGVQVIELLIALAEVLDGEAEEQDAASAPDGDGPEGGGVAGPSVGAASGGERPRAPRQAGPMPWEERGLLGIHEEVARGSGAYMGPQLTPEGDLLDRTRDGGEEDHQLFGGRIKPPWLRH